jgi:hypothetical protein
VLHPGSPRDLERISDVVRAADWFLPNHDQLRALTGRDDLTAAIGDVLALGVGGVAVTRGADGCLLAWRGGGAPLALPAIKVDVVDTTGCGDGFTAGMLAGLRGSTTSRCSPRSSEPSCSACCWCCGGGKSKPEQYGAGILTSTTSVFHNPTWYAFTLAGLLGAFTLVGFELAADMSEDAVDPRRSVPRGVLWAVLGSVVLGMVALIGFTLAIPHLKAVEEAPLPLLAIAGYWLPSWLVKVFVAFVVFSMFSILVVGSGAQARLVYSLSRDNMLPFSRALRKVNKRSQTPIVALLVFGVIDHRQPARRVHARPLGVASHRLRARLHRGDHGGAVLPVAVPRLGQDARLRPGARRPVVLRRPAAAAQERDRGGEAGRRPGRQAVTDCSRASAPAAGREGQPPGLAAYGSRSVAARRILAIGRIQPLSRAAEGLWAGNRWRRLARTSTGWTGARSLRTCGSSSRQRQPTWSASNGH